MKYPSIKILKLPDLPDKGDISDTIESGLTKASLIEKVKLQGEYIPEDCPKLYTAYELYNMHLPEPNWAVPNIISEGLNLLAGKPKQGKSFFALNIACSITCGSKALDRFEVQKGSVLYLALEDVPRRLKQRLIPMVDETLVNSLHRLSIFTEWPKLGEGCRRYLAMQIRKTPDLRLIIIDTLAKVRPLSSTKYNNLYNEDYSFINDIKLISDRFNIPILCIHHLNKSISDDIMDTVSGSLGLTAAADNLIVIARKTGQADAELIVNGRDIEANEYALKFDPLSLSWKLLGESQEIKSTNNRQILYSAFSNHPSNEHPLSPKDLHSITGLSQGYIYKTLPIMEKDGDIKKIDRGKYIFARKLGINGIGGQEGEEGQEGEIMNTNFQLKTITSDEDKDRKKDSNDREAILRYLEESPDWRCVKKSDLKIIDPSLQGRLQIP